MTSSYVGQLKVICFIPCHTCSIGHHLDFSWKIKIMLQLMHQIYSPFITLREMKQRRLNQFAGGVT